MPSGGQQHVYTQPPQLQGYSNIWATARQPSPQAVSSLRGCHTAGHARNDKPLSQHCNDATRVSLPLQMVEKEHSAAGSILSSVIQVKPLMPTVQEGLASAPC